MHDDERGIRTLAVADRVVQLLKEHGVEAAVIGAVACAAHGYARATADVDLATYADPFLKLPEILRALEAIDLRADFERPDADDPLGGVITIHGAAIDPIQIVDFYNPRATADNPGWAAIQSARAVEEFQALRVVDLAHLIALKLYAGGRKSELDVLELLERNPETDRAEVRRVCATFGLAPALDRLLVP